MASLPGGFELEMHVADEMRSRAVSASLVRLCMVGWLRAGELSDFQGCGLLSAVPGECRLRLI